MTVHTYIYSVGRTPDTLCSLTPCTEYTPPPFRETASHQSQAPTPLMALGSSEHLLEDSAPRASHAAA